MTDKKMTFNIRLAVKTAMVILAVIGIGMVIRRMFILTGSLPPAARPGFASFD